MASGRGLLNGPDIQITHDFYDQLFRQESLKGGGGQNAGPSPIKRAMRHAKMTNSSSGLMRSHRSRYTAAGAPQGSGPSALCQSNAGPKPATFAKSSPWGRCHLTRQRV